MSPHFFIWNPRSSSSQGRGFKNFRSGSRSGFALIITVTVMVLVTMLVLGLVAVSTSAIRVSRSQKAKAEAEQNARLAVSLALGRLQLLTGQDTRVTANSDLFTENGVKFTGAWRSWEGTDRESNGKPIPPDYEVKMRAGSAAVPVDSGNEGRFLGWLASSAPATAGTPGNMPDASATAKAGYVPLLGESSVAAADQQVHMKPTMLSGSRGSMAWWISGENTKAMIQADRGTQPASVASANDQMVAWQERARSNGRPDPKSFDLEGVNATTPGSLPTRDSLGLVAANPSAVRRFHDITSYNVGLLTNVANGGWKRDLSIFCENYTRWPTSFPAQTLRPGVVFNGAKAAQVPPPSNSSNILYPWAKYRTGSSAWEQVPPIASWELLADYAMSAQRVLSSTSSTRTTMTTFSGSTGGSRTDFIDKVRRVPQIARMQWVYGLTSKKVPTQADPEAHQAGLLVSPVFTVWNPYNVELAFNGIRVTIQESAPLRFKFKLAGTSYPETPLYKIIRNSAEDIAGKHYSTMTVVIPAGTLRPGENRIYSIPNGQVTDGNPGTGNVTVNLQPGYATGGGLRYFGLNGGNSVSGKASDTLSIEKIDFNSTTWEGSRTTGVKLGMGIIFDVNVQFPGGGSGLSHRMIYDKNELGGDTVVNALYPPLTNQVSDTLQNVLDRKNRPFASALFGYRMASPMSRDLARHRHLYSKGMLQANPLTNYTEIGFGDDDNAATSMDGTGVYHPVNAPYDFAFQEVNGWNDSMVIPQWEKSSGSTYIVSGLTPSEGLTRCVMAELPTRPLQSLGDLQHFDARQNNPIPPFQFNLIGNGSANPIFGPNQVAVATSFNNGMCNDDSYILNNLFFDDWFASSIATDLRAFSNRRERGPDDVYEEHLTAIAALPNRFYLPVRGADAPDAASASKAIISVGRDAKNGNKYTYEWIASKLQVEGMFNVNSVSLDAWKALLRQSRDLTAPILQPNGRTAAGSTAGVVFPRTSIAGDQGTDSKSSLSGNDFPSAVEFAGQRVLTDDQIDALAEEIVKQIRARGPFLSLSEFVNRQLSSNKDLAIAGTIQRALDVLAELGDDPKNPFHVMQENSVRITSLPPGDTDYKFPEAAYGWSAFGVPGWIRQADILRPIAPVLSARDDTFTLRAYGDARDSTSQSRVLARAWCEVVVRRTPDYVDTTDTAAVQPHSAEMQSPVNRIFGRRYEIVSFRWLSPDEI